MEGKVGSSGRTRTYNLVVTRIPKFLLGLDYLITRFVSPKGGCRALPPSYAQGTSLRSSLCTFPDRFGPVRAWLRVTIFRDVRKAGFLDFTRFFNHDFSWKLQPRVYFVMIASTQSHSCILQPPALPIELPRSSQIRLAKFGKKCNQNRYPACLIFCR